MNEKTDENVHLSVIVPVYNKEESIGNTLMEIDKYLSEQSYSYEILVVNDGSTDRTLEAAKGYKKLLKNLRALDSKKNLGTGFAIRQGILKARGDYILFSSAGGSSSIGYLDKVWPLVDKEYDIVIGSRNSKAVKKDRKNIVMRIVAKFAQIARIRSVWDAQNGFKFFTSKAANEISSKSKINKWGFDAEVLALADRLNYKVGNIKIDTINKKSNKFKFGDYISTFWEFLKIRWNLIRGVYDRQKTKHKET